MLASSGRCFAKEKFVTGFAKRLRRQLWIIDTIPTQLLCGASNNSSVSRKPEAGDRLHGICAPHFLVFEVQFFSVLARAKAIEEICGAACHHGARFLGALACYIATQQSHEARSLLCGVVWPLSHNLRALRSRQPDVHFAHHVFLHTRAAHGSVAILREPSWHVPHSGPCAHLVRVLPTFEASADRNIQQLFIFSTISRITEGASDHLWRHFGRDLAYSCIIVPTINFWRARHWTMFSRMHDAKKHKKRVTFEGFIFPKLAYRRCRRKTSSRMPGRLSEGLTLGDFKTTNPAIFPASFCHIFRV